MYNYHADGRNWESLRLLDPGEFMDRVTFCNQEEYGDGQLEGEWWYADDSARVIYYGSFGNYNSPGASSCTWAEVYGAEEEAEYREQVAHWEAQPEYAGEDCDTVLAPTDPDDDSEGDGEG